LEEEKDPEDAVPGEREVNRELASFIVSLNMDKKLQFTAVIEKEGDGYVSLCPELDIASQGDTVEEATANLKEALQLFFETASPTEIKERTHGEVYVTRLDVAVG
jgi:predicted RNase H-like HicB family nuclease